MKPPSALLAASLCELERLRKSGPIRVHGDVRESVVCLVDADVADTMIFPSRRSFMLNVSDNDGEGHLALHHLEESSACADYVASREPARMWTWTLEAIDGQWTSGAFTERAASRSVKIGRSQAAGDS